MALTRRSLCSSSVVLTAGGLAGCTTVFAEDCSGNITVINRSEEAHSLGLTIVTEGADVLFARTITIRGGARDEEELPHIEFEDVVSGSDGESFRVIAQNPAIEWTETHLWSLECQDGNDPSDSLYIHVEGNGRIEIG